MTNVIQDLLDKERELQRLKTLPRFVFADRKLAELFAKLIQQYPFGTTEPEPEPQKPTKELVKFMRERNKVRRWNDTLQRQALSVAEHSYDQLDGEWHDWLEVARRYEVKVPYQDREDMRHDIMIELAKARHRDNQPLPLLRAYRIASLMVALYWRELVKHEIKVCIYSGLPTEPHCASCRRKPKSGACPYLALRPIQSLDSEATDDVGNTVRLKDTVADDNAIDLDCWLDAKIFILGCPLRLVQIASKRRQGIPLNDTDQRYFTRQRLKELKRYQLTLF